jgi:hypothetical protein
MGSFSNDNEMIIIIVGLFFAFGALCATIDLFVPGLIYAFLDGVFSQFRQENIYLEDNDCECDFGLLDNGERCQVCNSFPESPDSKINDITEIIENYKSKKQHYIPPKVEKGTMTKTWENKNGLRPSKIKRHETQTN